jgi:hypothetical protein
MLAEMIEKLSDLARRSAKPELLTTDPRLARFVVEGAVVEFPVPAPPRRHEVACLAEVVALANRFAADGGTPVVWYDARHVVLVIDDAGHRVETATLDLEVSDVFARLARLRAERSWLDQRAFVRLLRVELARTLEPVVLLEKVKRLKFENGVTTTGHVGRAAESLGREITSKLERGEELPEQVTLSAPVYKTAGETDPLPVRCSVEVNTMEGTFQLMPLPDEIERVLTLAVASIRDRLNDLAEGVPAYHGRP